MTTSERIRRTAWGALATLAIVGGLVACGDDDAPPEEAFCEAGDALRADVAELADLDIISGGTDALRERLDVIEQDLVELRDAGRDVAADEIDALQMTLDDLEASIATLGDGSVEPSGVADLLAVIGDVGRAAGDVVSAVADACP